MQAFAPLFSKNSLPITSVLFTSATMQGGLVSVLTRECFRPRMGSMNQEACLEHAHAIVSLNGIASALATGVYFSRFGGLAAFSASIIQLSAVGVASGCYWVGMNMDSSGSDASIALGFKIGAFCGLAGINLLGLGMTAHALLTKVMQGATRTQQGMALAVWIAYSSVYATCGTH